MKFSLFVLVALWAAAACAAPNIALYYGANPPWDELRAFDVVVVEPDHGFDPQRLATPSTELFAYVSLGEVQPSRAYAKDIPPGWLPATNSAFGSRIVDQAQPLWREFFLDRIVAPLWERGYRGFFLDTLDSYHLIAKTDAARAAQEAGMVTLVRDIRAAARRSRQPFVLPPVSLAEARRRRCDHRHQLQPEDPALLV